MTSTGTLKPLKWKWQFAYSSIAPQTQTYDTLVILALKCLICTLVISYLFLIYYKYTVFVASLLFSIS